MNHRIKPWLCCLALLAPLGGHAATLESERLTATIDEATGMVISIVDRRDDTPLVGHSPDRYALQPDPETEIIASEAEDVATPLRARGAYQATNPKLPGVRIAKHYRVVGNWLEKRVTFKADRRDVGLLKYTVTTTADPGFYRDGYLNDPSRHPIDYPYIFTRELTEDRPMRNSHAVADHHWAIYTNPTRGGGLAQYRFKVNDEYVHPLSSYSYEPGLLYRPDGWQVAVAAHWMTDERPGFSAITRWHVFDGDHLDFQQEYLALPECAAEWDWPSPDWLADVKGIAGWTWGSDSLNTERFRDYIEAYDDGVLLVMIGGIFTNTRNYVADPMPTPSGIDMPAEVLRRFVDELHAISPRIKVGPMTWQWAFGELDPVFREHPEWTVHDGDGEPVFAATGWAHERVYSQLLTPECREHNLRQFRGMVHRYDFDFIYMDTGQGGVTRFDWATRRCAQDYDWAEFYRGIRDAARSNRGGATFFNGTPRLYSQYADCGYFEGMSFVKVRCWQALANRLLLVKLYQPGDKWTMPLYWRDDNTEEYINYCYLLGIKPGGFGGGLSLRRWPMVSAADELRNSRLVTAADARPCWWKQHTDVECYALRIPGGAMLNAWQHGEESGEVTCSCLAEPLGLDPDRPIHAWLYRPRSAAEMVETARITEAKANELFRDGHSAAYRVMEPTWLGGKRAEQGRVTVSYHLDAGQLGLVLLTQADRLAHVVDGRPTQFLLPASDDATETVAADAPLPEGVAARRYRWEPPADIVSPVMVPRRSTPESANRTVTEVNRGVAGVRVERLLTIDCDHNLADNASAAIQGDTIRLTADMGDEKLYGFASAAVESPDLGRLRLRVALAEPFYKRFATTATGAWVGLIADYHTAVGYTRRVRFAVVPCGLDAVTSTRPWWGVYETTSEAPPPCYVDLDGQVPIGGEAELSIDLGRYAPVDWDGRVLFGPALESCGIGSQLEVDVLGNEAAGPRVDEPFSPLPVVTREDGAVLFQGATVVRFEDGAVLRDRTIVFPPNGCIEALGLRVITWRIRRDADSRVIELMVNYQLADGSYQLVRRDLSGQAKPGEDSRFDIDLGQWAPTGWNGRIRMRLRGDPMDAALVANSTLQIF